MRLSAPASSTTHASVFPVSPAGSRSLCAIRGMHLDREHLTRVEELQQQRKSAETPGQLSHHLFRKLLQQLTDGLPFERSVGNAARMVFAVAQYPRFADRAVARQRRREQAGQTPAAPEPILIDRLEPQRIQKDLTVTRWIHSDVFRSPRMGPSCHDGIHSVLVMPQVSRIAEYFPWRHCIRRGAQPGCSLLDDTALAAPATRGHLRLAKSPEPVAGWRGQTKTPTPRAAAT